MRGKACGSTSWAHQMCRATFDWPQAIQGWFWKPQPLPIGKTRATSACLITHRAAGRLEQPAQRRPPHAAPPHSRAPKAWSHPATRPHATAAAGGSMCPLACWHRWLYHPCRRRWLYHRCSAAAAAPGLVSLRGTSGRGRGWRDSALLGRCGCQLRTGRGGRTERSRGSGKCCVH